MTDRRKYTDDDFTQADLAALKLAMETAREDPAEKEHLDSLLQERGWHDVSVSAAYHCQTRHLSLKPWQEPPCVEDEDEPHPRDPNAQKILRMMLERGISRYHPDPLLAMAQAQDAARRTANKHGDAKPRRRPTSGTAKTSMPVTRRPSR